MRRPARVVGSRYDPRRRLEVRVTDEERVSNLAWCDRCGGALCFTFGVLGETLEICRNADCAGHAPHPLEPPRIERASEDGRVSRPTLDMAQL